MTYDASWGPVTGYFGPAYAMREGEVMIPTPVGRSCVLCDERIVDGDQGTVNWVDQVMHHECTLRSLVGSVGHQRGLCSCFGGTQDDPEGMTRREAAIAASHEFYRRRVADLS